MLTQFTDAYIYICITRGNELTLRLYVTWWCCDMDRFSTLLAFVRWMSSCQWIPLKSALNTMTWNHWTWGMNKVISSHTYHECNYISILGLKFILVSKRCPDQTLKSPKRHPISFPHVQIIRYLLWAFFKLTVIMETLSIIHDLYSFIQRCPELTSIFNLNFHGQGSSAFIVTVKPLVYRRPGKEATRRALTDCFYVPCVQQG